MRNLSELKKLRESLEISIEQAGKELGIPAGYLSQIENGKRQISVERANQIAHLYGKQIEEFFLPTRYAVRKV
ncbi:helix-turn-helix transcriptional regulator [Priestia taiwanensis]|uniref:helix-turn-helix domain-containing protein n=1 Tax=Priestia taiwanensis TaxID=1347902 RepID=UPI0027E5146D|nr:helix-turn-helix transcriptional regulator [Priestia taiwanensis]